MAQTPRIAFFGAHPDDCEIFAGGLARAFAQSGATVTFVIVTDGALSEGPPSNPELAARRKVEATAAAAHIGAQIEMLGFPDGSLSLASEANAAIDAAITRLSPDLLITHHERDYHRDHREVSRLVRGRIDPLQRFLYMEPLYGVSASPNTLVDITAHWDAKEAAIIEHKSQFGERDILPRAKAWNTFRAVQMAKRNVAYAEGFVVPPDVFADPLQLLSTTGKVRRMGN
jgi:LmbE family N-acetylglucosaminyl deacetylase